MSCERGLRLDTRIGGLAVLLAFAHVGAAQTQIAEQYRNRDYGYVVKCPTGSESKRQSRRIPIMALLFV